MKRLFKAGLVVLTLIWGVSASAQQCPDGGYLDASISCVGGNGAPHAYGTDPRDGGGSGYGDNGSNSAPPQVIYRKLPDSWGAVAFNPATSRYGSASKQASKQASRQAALNDCDKQGCKILSTYSNQCMAFAGGQKTRGNYVIAGFNINSRIAEQNALASCSKYARNCQILLSECSLPS